MKYNELFSQFTLTYIVYRNFVFMLKSYYYVSLLLMFTDTEIKKDKETSKTFEETPKKDVDHVAPRENNSKSNLNCSKDINTEEESSRIYEEADDKGVTSPSPAGNYATVISPNKNSVPAGVLLNTRKEPQHNNFMSTRSTIFKDINDASNMSKGISSSQSQKHIIKSCTSRIPKLKKCTKKTRQEPQDKNRISANSSESKFISTSSNIPTTGPSNMSKDINSRIPKLRKCTKDASKGMNNSVGSSNLQKKNTNTFSTSNSSKGISVLQLQKHKNKSFTSRIPKLINNGICTKDALKGIKNSADSSNHQKKNNDKLTFFK